MIKRGKRLCSLLVFLLLALTVSYAAYADEYTIKSIYINPETNYLGTGFNSITGTFINDSNCVSFSNIVTKTVGGMSNSTYFAFVDSPKELEDKFLYNFSGNGGVSDMTTALSKVTQAILDNTTFSTDKITLIAYWKQEDKKVLSNDLPSLTDEGMATLKADSKKFFQLYGDKYVSSVTLGKIFFVVYQADISKYANYSIRTKNAIRRAMELSVKKIFGSKLTGDESTFVSDKLANIQITSSTYGNDIPDFVGPYTADDFRSIIKKVSATSSTVITRELKNYTATTNWQDDPFYDISEYVRMVREWKTHLSYINYILANQRLGYDLTVDCNTAKDIINNQLRLAFAMDPDARMPNNKELINFYSLYNRYITKMQIVPRTYAMQPIQKQLDVDLSNLEDVETIRIEFSYTAAKSSNGFLQGIFGGGSKQQFEVILYIVDEDGNLSEVQRAPVTAKQTTIVLYDGIKFGDKFKIGFSDEKITAQDTKITCSFTEKTNDIVWQLMYNKSRNETKTPAANGPNRY